MATLALRRFSGAFSEPRDTRFGRAPPNPRPVNRRAQVSEAMSQASGVASENTPKITMDATSTPLRPMRSARRPPMMAPMNRPTVLALKKYDSNWLSGWNCCRIPAAATPAVCRSMPSQSVARKHSRMVRPAPPRAAAGCEFVMRAKITRNEVIRVG